MLTQKDLQDLLSYDPDTGAFVWKVNLSRVAKVGSLAATKPGSAGYARIGINGARYLAHRLAWLYVHGFWPIEDVDHINRNRMDNCISNLRLASRSQNLQNTVLRSATTSGHKGVYWNRRARKWQAHIKANGAYHYLGVHKNLMDAVAVREAAEIQLHTHRPTV